MIGWADKYSFTGTYSRGPIFLTSTPNTVGSSGYDWENTLTFPVSLVHVSTLNFNGDDAMGILDGSGNTFDVYGKL